MLTYSDVSIARWVALQLSARCRYGCHVTKSLDIQERQYEDRVLRSVWGSLSPAQQALVADLFTNARDAYRRHRMSISTMRALDRRGLTQLPPPSRLTDLGSAVAKWAFDHGHVIEDGNGGWATSKPDARAISSDRHDRIADLAAQGFGISEIARELGTSRQAVDYVCRAHRIAPLKPADLRIRITELQARIDELERKLAG
jgi:hypothetical protein